MKILVFEYSTLTNQYNILSEGYNMLKGVLTDLNTCSDLNVDYLISDEIIIDNVDYCNKIALHTDLEIWLEENCENYDCCLFIAPEDDYIQYHITTILEQHDIKIIGPDSTSSYICSSKYRTYCNLDDNILKIPTIFATLDEINFDLVEEKINKTTVVVKPDNYTSSNYIFKANSMEEFEEIIEVYKKNNINEILIQDYVEGVPISSSILCNQKHIQTISINSQIIEENDKQISYMGCLTPIHTNFEQEILKLNKKIIKSLDGLRGFVGIDYIISNKDIYLVEINSRLTTPFIVLHDNTNINLSKYLIDMVLYDNIENIIINKEGCYNKEVIE